MLSHCRVSAFVITLACTLGGTSLAGQPSDEPARADETKAVARALFEEGLAHADAQRWPEAADRFERARRLRSSPEIIYNLTTALMHLGKLVRAAELLREVVAAPDAAPAVREASRVRLGQLRPRLAYLTVTPPSGGVEGADVFVDGHPFDAARLGVALPMDPANHTVHLRRAGAIVGRSDILLLEGERRTVSLDVVASDAASAGTAATASQTGVVHLLADPGWGAPRSSPTGVAARAERPSRKWIWVVAGAVVAGAATAAVIASRDSSGPPSGNVDTWKLGGP